MGIKDLWSILIPYCERKPLYELQGKVVAVDLSCWICEAQNIAEYQVQPRMYLRNLYFRTCYLLLMEVTPVFVLEGKAPELKYQTIADRNAVQFKGAKPKTDKIKTGKDRSRFHHVLKQCEEMLRYMGLACVKGSGEAESMCAYLNEDDMVAGCISQDSDCFAYGAKVVFRNFSISSQGSYSASGDFGRNKIIALALLCGSDYNDGVHGIGKESALKFMNRYEDKDILDRMRAWREQSTTFDELENKIGDKNICTSCGHVGKVQSHTKSGCFDCKTTRGCDFSKYREERLEIKNELMIRSKALADPDFPNENLIKEYLLRKDNIKKLDLRWRQPNLVNFVKFTNKFLGWEEIYAFEKFLPILTRWQVLNYEYVMECISNNCHSEIKGIVEPDHIKKNRNPKGIKSYEIIWNHKNEFFDHLIPEEQIDKYKECNKDGLEALWSTIEPSNLVEKAYPKLVEEFLEKKNKKAKKPSKRKKKDKAMDELNDMLHNTSISEPKAKRTRKKTKKQETIENFLENVKENLSENNKLDQIPSLHTKVMDELNEMLHNTSISEPKSKEADIQMKKQDNYYIDNYLGSYEENLLDDIRNIGKTTLLKTKVNVLKQQSKRDSLSVSFDLDASGFGDEDDLNISDIVDNIVNRTPKLPAKLEKLGYFIETTRNKFESSKKFTSDEVICKEKHDLLVQENDRVYSNLLDILHEEPLSLNQNFSPDSKNKSMDKIEFYEEPLQQNLCSGDENNADNLNKSYFFEINNEQIDLFEKSLHKNTFSDHESSDDTIEYEVDEEKICDSKECDDFRELSFEETYVPLLERIKALRKC